MLLRPLFILALTLFNLGIANAAGPMRYIHPPPENANDKRLEYYYDMLKAALDATSKTYGPYEIGTSSQPMNTKRMIDTLTKGEEITVAVTTGSAEKEQALLPVRIPLDKGLTGYRLFLIKSETQARVDKIKSLDELKQFKIGQAASWIDTKILTAAGLTVEPGVNYDNLFKMLEGGRFDLFPRGVNEIAAEHESGKATIPSLAIESNLMLYYPLPRYFFFTRNAQGEALAKRIDDGLRILVKNGEFDKRYQAFKKTTLAGLKLNGRRVFKLPNPTLSPETPLNQAEHWDTLAKEIKG